MALLIVMELSRRRFVFRIHTLYDQAKAYLIDEQHIRDYCEGITGLSYIEDRDQNVLILKFL